MFTANVGSHDYMGELLRFFKAHGWTRIAMLTSIDATGKDTEHAVEVGLTEPAAAGLKLVAQEHFANQDISVAGQVARIKAANPQVLVAWTSGTQFGTVLRNIIDGGMAVPIVASSANLSHAQLGQYRSYAPKLYFMAGGGAAVQPQRGAVRDAQLAYVKAFRDAGVRPEYLNTIAWDPAMVVVDALRHVGASAAPDAIRSYIAGLHDWAGIVGTYDFRKNPQRGIGGNAATMYQWDPATDEITVLPIR
jgi:branched-chain amino acid transport system substrate-binding protein